MRAVAARPGRTIGFSLSLRSILTDTEGAAWKRADAIPERTRAQRAALGLHDFAGAPKSEVSERLLLAAAQGAHLDKRRWTGVARVTGAQSDSTALVGTGEEAAEALLDYYNLRISTSLIRGFHPLET